MNLTTISRPPTATRYLSPPFLALILLLLILAMASTACSAPVSSPSEQVQIWSAPLLPRIGEKLGIMAVATDGELTDLYVTDPTGRRNILTTMPGGGPPWSLRGEIATPTRGSYRVEALRGKKIVATATINVGSSAGYRGAGEWDLPTQALYAAWVEHLFDAPPEESLSFPSLEPVLRDPQRNFLYDYLNQGEDSSFPAEPDCADLSFFLRAYFAWKLGLPVSYRACNRGSAKSAPSCDPAEIDHSFVDTSASVQAFRKVSRRIMDRATSGGGRTALTDDATDFYPVPLKREALWPGTVYADPYGHTLIIVKWIPQTEKRSGMLLAVDAQPDNSVARKRFWEGNFLFAATPSAGPGFKAYRTPVPGSNRGKWSLPTNLRLSDNSGFLPYSTEQQGLAPEDFYARMERLINPRGLSPDTAYAATLDALIEQLETRVRSVDNGETYMRSHPGTIAPMPRGPAIFETIGLWEDYATPSRDMRILIALKVLESFPERIRRHPELFVLKRESAAEAAARIEQLHARQSKERFITYTRSNGSPWKLSLAEIYARRPGLEVAYNPNDCVERRWGATPDSPDFPGCRRQAPAEQRARMEEYRPWFHEARRPPR